MATIEAIKAKANKEYAIRELANVLDATKKSKDCIGTSRSFANAMEYYGKTDRFHIICAGVHVYVAHPKVTEGTNDEEISIFSDADPLSGVTVTVERVMGWLAELQKD